MPVVRVVSLNALVLQVRVVLVYMCHSRFWLQLHEFIECSLTTSAPPGTGPSFRMSGYSAGSSFFSSKLISIEKRSAPAPVKIGMPVDYGGAVGATGGSCARDGSPPKGELPGKLGMNGELPPFSAAGYCAGVVGLSNRPKRFGLWAGYAGYVCGASFFCSA